MNTMRAIDPNKIMTAAEILSVLSDLKRKGKRSPNTRQNLVIFRLATFCGLRVSEVCGLKLGNVKLDALHPCIKVPRAIGKRKKARTVPIMDAGTLADLAAWRSEREAQGATNDSPFVCSQSVDTFGKPLAARNAQSRFKASIKCLGKERVSALSIHCGRHSFCSHYLKSLTQQLGDVGQALLTIRDAAGHSDITTTSIYLHSVDKKDRTKVDMLAHFSGE